MTVRSKAVVGLGCSFLLSALAACGGDGVQVPIGAGEGPPTSGESGARAEADSGTIASGEGGNPQDVPPGNLVTEQSPGFDFFASLEAEDALGGSDFNAACLANHDPVTTALCPAAGGTAPAIPSIAALQRLVGLPFLPGLTVSAHNGNPGYAVVTHSTSLSTRLVTPQNPRAVFFKSPFDITSPTQGIAMAYSRGEARAELAGYDAQTKQFNYYLVVFKKPLPTTFDRLGPNADQGFSSYSVYSSRALENTVLDCTTCHRGGTLVMQGLDAPWLHWAATTDVTNAMFVPPAKALVSAYNAVHVAPETFAGISKMDDNRPQYLQTFLKYFGQDTTQPGAYPSKGIETEFLSSGKSPTWDLLFAQVVTGDALPIPSYTVDPTNVAKTTAYTAAYTQIAKGTLPADQLPDPTALFEPAELQRFSIEPPSGATPQVILADMCGSCHSSKFTDPSRSRYRFRVDALSQMSQAEKHEAARRLRLAPGTPGHMPPTRFHRLNAAEITAVAAFLTN